MNLAARVRRILGWARTPTPEDDRVLRETRHGGRDAPLPLGAWGEPLLSPGIEHHLPNDDVARAIDTLSGQIPPGLRCDLLTLSADTVRVVLHGFGRTVDITRQAGCDHCHVKVYTFASGSLGTTGLAAHPDTTAHNDVALTELAALLAQPRPGSRSSPARTSWRRSDVLSATPVPLASTQ